MKEILIVLSGGREKGNTAQLADAFMKGAVEAGHHVELVSLNKMDVWGVTPADMEKDADRKMIFIPLFQR